MVKLVTEISMLLSRFLKYLMKIKDKATQCREMLTSLVLTEIMSIIMTLFYNVQKILLEITQYFLK